MENLFGKVKSVHSISYRTQGQITNFDTREQLKKALDLVVKNRFRHREYSIEEDNVRFFFEKVE